MSVYAHVYYILRRGVCQIVKYAIFGPYDKAILQAVSFPTLNKKKIIQNGEAPLRKMWILHLTGLTMVKGLYCFCPKINCHEIPS